MSKIHRLLASALPLALAVIAFAFSITALLSPKWAQQAYYPDSGQTTWAVPDYTLYRSPFITCSPTPHNATSDDSTSDNSTVTTVWTVECSRYPVFGVGNRSCEVVALTKMYEVAQTGDYRLCQQIYLAGNLAIASTVFIGLGFLLTLIMSAACATVLLSSSSSGGNGSAAQQSEDAVATGAWSSEKKSTRHRPSHHHRYLSPVAPYVNLVLTMSLTIGAVMFVLAQFYGVEAFVQSAPDNGVFASGQGASNQDPTLQNNHGPWVQGEALTIYASVAWLSSALAAAAAVGVWRLPHAKPLL